MSDLPIKGSNFGFGSGSSSAGSGGGELSSRGPLRMVLVSGLLAGEPWSTRSRVAPEPVPVDKSTFDKVMVRLAPAFAIEVRDPFAPDAEPLKVDLRFGDLKAMRADGIVEQVPVLRALVEARKIVAQMKDRKLSVDDGKRQLARILPRPSWTEHLTGEVSQGVTPPPADRPSKPAAKRPSEDALDALFDQVGIKDADVTAEPPPVAPAAKAKEKEAASAFSSLIASVARGGKAATAPKPAAVVGSTLEKVERAFGRIFAEILHHPEVRRLERSWRGLKMLIDGVESRSGVEIDVIAVEKDGVEGAVLALAEKMGVESSRAPVDVFLIDHDVDANADDASLLSAWSRACAEHHAPLVVNGLPSLLGAAQMTDLPKALRALGPTDDPRPETSRGLSAQEATKWLTVAMNGPLVRAAYTSSSSRLRDISFSENPKDLASHVFAGASIAVGLLCAQSYVKTGWPTGIVGPRDGSVPNLSVHEVEEGGQTYAIPLEVLCSDETLREAARAGIAMFGCGANHDAAFLLRAPTFHEKTARAGHGTLGDQLFMGRFASAVQQVAAAIPRDVDPKAAAQAAEIALFDLFEKAAPAGPEVSARVSGGSLTVTVRPRRHAGVMMEELTLSAPLA